MIRRNFILLGVLLCAATMALPGAVSAAAENCETEPRSSCFAIESVEASLSTSQAGAHPDLQLNVALKQNPQSTPNVFGLHDSYAAARDIRFETPPGLIGNPNALGPNQQCSVQQLVAFNQPGGGCPNGSQVGVTTITAYDLQQRFHEPVYIMQPPGGNVVARLGTIAGLFPTFIDFRLRSESDYGLVAEVVEAPTTARLVKLETTLWGVPAAASHDHERCTPQEAFANCVSSESRPPGGNEVAFLTNPTRCGVPLEMGVNASSWAEPQLRPENEVRASFPEITGCNSLPFGPSLEVEPTSHHTSSPTGLDLTIKLPASEGVKVLEPAQLRSIRIDFPPGLAISTDASDGLSTCSPAQVRFEEDAAAECPDAAKLASTEFDVPVLERNIKGAIYLREPEPGHPFRIWIVADDLGLHIKLPGDLEVDKATGQVHSIVLGAPQLEGMPQAPLREVKLLLKSGFRAPLVTPDHCGTFYTHYEFIPWSGGPPAVGSTPMQITEGCDTGGFAPKLSAGSTESQGGAFAPFTFTITRQDGEQNLAGLEVTLPKGIAASFAGIPRCEGAAAETGACPLSSRVGGVTAAVGAGPDPLWVPQPGKRPTAVYLSGPYKGAPLSIVAVVPKQAGPFDFGDEVVRSAVYVDPVTARATAVADPLPQQIEGIPITYRDLNVTLDRPHFTLNPTSCAPEQSEATLTSSGGKIAHPGSPYAATNCATLPFRPSLAIKLFGGTHRGSHPKLRATVRMPAGGANIGAAQVALPHSEFLDQGHIKTVCTRVQFAEGAGNGEKCPPGSVYGAATAKTPLFDFPLSGPVYLRSSSNPLPDLVAALKGPASMPVAIDLDGRVDSVHGGIRTSFESVPDAPVSEFTLEMKGGKKGLLVNSQNLCKGTRKAIGEFTGQNGRRYDTEPAVKAQCPKKKKVKADGKGNARLAVALRRHVAW
jgi:hypothetical protein